MKQFLTYAVLIAAVVFVGCSEEDPVKPPPTGTPFEDLTERGHVLLNLERSYNQRNITEYQKLLDDNFIFFFSDGDVGGEIPEQWDKSAEENATGNMFNPNYNGPNPIISISLDLSLLNVQWIATLPEDPAFAGETWYTTTVTYDYTIQAAPDISFIVTNNPKAQYTVREIDVNGVKYWRLVQWRDLATSGRALTVGKEVLGTEETTWGVLKAIYTE